jgi:biotin operon repressor
MKTTRHRTGRRYTTDELKKLMDMWEAGSTVLEIAEVLKTGSKGVDSMVVRLRREGIPLTRRTRGHKTNRFNKPWTQEEIEYLFRRRLEGDTADDIASSLGRTASAVAGMINKLRDEGVPVAMRGNGVRRLWNAESLKAAAVGRFDSTEIALAADVEDYLRTVEADELSKGGA